MMMRPSTNGTATQPSLPPRLLPPVQDVQGWQEAWPWLLWQETFPLPLPPASQDDVDAYWMQRAFTLALKGWAGAAPNPWVGCVIVDAEGCCIGEGWHRRYGEAHAEPMALAAALEHRPNLAGCTVYVSLEPCSHQGKTPPCCDALVAAQPKRVVIAALDANPLVAGRGLNALQAAGIATTVGVMEAAALALNRPFFGRLSQHRPYSLLKLATTLDGKIATRTGHSQWISSPEAREWVHWMRLSATAVLSTARTVLADNARLTPRLPAVAQASLLEGGYRPYTRIVLDAQGRLFTPKGLAQSDLALWDAADAAFPLLVFVGEGVCLPPADALPSHVRTQILPLSDEGRFVLDALFASLHALGFGLLWWEVGPEFASALLQGGWVDELFLVQAPCLLGDAAAPCWYQATAGQTPITKMTHALRGWKALPSHRVGGDGIHHFQRLPKTL